jgi:hypothetical protein
MADSIKHIVRVASLAGRRGPTTTAGMLFAAGLSLGLFELYIAALHIYSMVRLRPLLAGLPRTNERIGMREGFERFAAKISTKLLVVMGFGGTAILTDSAINTIEFFVMHRPLDQFPLRLVPGVCGLIVGAPIVYRLVLRVRQRDV